MVSDSQQIIVVRLKELLGQSTTFIRISFLYAEQYVLPVLPIKTFDEINIGSKWPRLVPYSSHIGNHIVSIMLTGKSEANTAICLKTSPIISDIIRGFSARQLWKHCKRGGGGVRVERKLQQPCTRRSRKHIFSH